MRVSRWSDLLIALGVLVLVSVVLLPSTWRQLAPEGLPIAAGGAAAPQAVTTGRAPVRVVASDVPLDAAVDPVGVAADGALVLPEDVTRAGWWTGGATAGDAKGSAVIAGHVDSREGVGAMYAMHQLKPGMRVQVQTADGREVGYVVTGSKRYHKTRLPAELFSTSGDHRLVLITCGGPFNAAIRSYRDNVVVTAEPVA